MIGNQEHPGVMVLTMKELFATMQERTDTTFDVTISYLEIYNETIRDLLVKNSKPLDLRESADAGVQVAGLSSHTPSSADEVLQLLEVGNSRRCQSATGANAQSSRSHAVLQICVQQRDRTANVSSEVKTGKLSLIDLAGSERASRTKTRGQQLVEGANINKSLLALGNCINALGQDYKEGKYVPYRNSKLTRLLKDSLGGNCKTVMIANVSPSSLSYEDTYNTLNYANRAKNIKTKVHTNQINVTAHVSEYKVLIERLRAEIGELKVKIREYEQNGRVAGSDTKEKSRIDEIRSEISRAVHDRVTVQNNLKQLHKQETDLQLQKDTTQQKVEDWQLQKWDRTSSSRISGALGAVAEMKPPTSPMDIHQARRKLQDLDREEQELKDRKQTLIRRLERNADDAKQIHSSVPSKVVSELGRRQLERDLSIHWLELEKMNRDVEIQRQDAMIRALQKQLTKSLDLVETQNSVLEENGLLDPKIQQSFATLMLTPNQKNKRNADILAGLAAPYFRMRSPLVTESADPYQDLPELSEAAPCDSSEGAEHDEAPTPVLVNLSQRFTSASRPPQPEKENRADNVQTSRAPISKPLPVVRGKFGFSQPPPRAGQSSVRKTPSKAASILQIRRKVEDQFPASHANLKQQHRIGGGQFSNVRTPQRSGRAPAKWTPVESKRSQFKTVRFADDTEPSGGAGTPTRTPRSGGGGFPAIPTPTSISKGRGDVSTPTKITEPDSLAQEKSAISESSMPQLVEAVHQPQDPRQEIVQTPEEDFEEFAIPQPPARLAEYESRMTGALNL